MGEEILVHIGYRNRILLCLLAIFILCFTSLEDGNADASMQQMTNSNLKGIDVSHWNGTIDWKKVKSSGIAFAYVKATEGTTISDSMFAENVKGARAVGLPVGAYHYARPSVPFNQNEAKQEAEYFVNFMKNNGMSDFGDIMPVLDLEEPAAPGSLTSDELAQWARIFIDTSKALMNKQVMLYSGAWFVLQYDNFGGKLSDLPIWIAAYTRYGYTEPPACGGWTQWTIWQYSDQGTVSGVSGQVDLNAGPTSMDVLKGSQVPPKQTGTQIVIDKSQYTSADYAKITTIVKDDHGAVLPAADVTLTIETPKGTTTISGKTNSSGSFVYNYFIPKRVTGTYKLSVKTTLSNYQSSSESSFNVIK